MKFLLGSLLLATVCWLGTAKNFKNMPTFDNKKIAGSWYPLANIVIAKHFPHYTLVAEAKRNMMFSFKYRVFNQCKTRKLKLLEQGEPGAFKAKKTLLLKVLDTDYKTYSITYMERTMDSFLGLAGREKTLTPELKTKFQEFASSVGVTGEIIPVTADEGC